MNSTAYKIKPAATLLWVVQGEEEYGVSSTVISFSEALRAQGWNIAAISMTEGSMTRLLRAKKWEICCLDLKTSPKMITGNLLSKVVQYRRSNRFQMEAVERWLQNQSIGHIAAVQTCSELLLDVCARIAEVKGAVAIWRMAGSVRQNPAINPTRCFLQYKCWSRKIIAMGNSDFTTKSLGPGPAVKHSNLHGCDTSRFNSEIVNPITRLELGIPESAVVFTIVSRLDESGNKGQLQFLKALQGVGMEEHDLYLLLVGGPVDGRLANEISEITRESDSKRVQLIGNVSDVEKYYGAVDVAVSCRLTPEPFGLSVIEAMMMGRPVLAHGLGGPSETIIDGKTGWITNDPSIGGLANAVVRTLSDKKKWGLMGATARKHALTCFSIESEVERWKRIVESAQ